MAQLHDLRLRLLVQQETEQIAKSQPTDLDLSVVQARCLCWLALLAEAHEDQANDAEGRGDIEQAMGWFADSMRLKDVIQLVTSIEIPLPEALESTQSDCEDDSFFHLKLFYFRFFFFLLFALFRLLRIGLLSIKTESVEVVVIPVISFFFSYEQSFSLSSHQAYNDNLWELFSFSSF